VLDLSLQKHLQFFLDSGLTNVKKFSLFRTILGLLISVFTTAALLFVVGIIDWTLSYPTSQTLLMLWSGFATLILFLFLFWSMALYLRYQTAKLTSLFVANRLGIDQGPKMVPALGDLYKYFEKDHAMVIRQCIFNFILLAAIFSFSPLLGIVVFTSTLIFIILAFYSESAARKDSSLTEETYLTSGLVSEYESSFQGVVQDLIQGKLTLQQKEMFTNLIARLLQVLITTTLFFLSLRFLDPTTHLMDGLILSDTLSVGGAVGMTALTYLYLDPFQRLPGAIISYVQLKQRFVQLGVMEYNNALPSEKQPPRLFMHAGQTPEES